MTGGAVTLAFQQVDDPTPGKNKVHLDLIADDIDAEVDRLVAAGATLVERRGDENFTGSPSPTPTATSSASPARTRVRR